MKKIIILLFTILTFNIVNAQWQQTSLDSNFVRTIAINGNNIFVGTGGGGGGVYLSTNNGNSWTLKETGLSNNQVWGIGFNGSYTFVAEYGVYLSTNNGNNWSISNSGITTNNMTALTVFGSNIFAGTAANGVFLSTNNGSSWTAINNGLSTNTVYTFTNSGSNIFAGTYNGGVFLSTNNGSSWTAVNNGLSTSNSINSFATSGSNIFAATDGGIFLSTNNGGSWSAINTGLTNLYTRAIAISGSNIFAGTVSGVFLSTNNGSSWTAINTGLTDTNICSLALSGNTIFAGTVSHGILKRSLIDTITTSSNPTIGGTTNGGGTFLLNQSCTVKAIPSIGYIFVSWKENGNIVSTDTSYTFTVTANRNLVANFTLNTTQYSITTSASPTTGGSTSGGGTFNNNQSCTVKATPNTSYSFVNWKENATVVSTDTSYTFTVTANRNLVANFTQNAAQYAITTSSSPTIGGTTNGGGTFNNNQSCTVKANASNGYTFVNWTENGSTVSTDTNYTFTVSANRNLVANFLLITLQYTITTSTVPSNGGIAFGGGTFTYNQTCNLKAQPANNFIFISWSENGVPVSIDTNYTFTVTANRNLVANFFSTLGIEEISLWKSAYLYPNPSIGQTTVVYPLLNTEGEVQIYNSIGQIVYKGILTKGSTKTELNIQNYKTGLYKVVLRENGVIKGQVSLVRE